MTQMPALKKALLNCNRSDDLCRVNAVARSGNQEISNAFQFAPPPTIQEDKVNPFIDIEKAMNNVLKLVGKIFNGIFKPVTTVLRVYYKPHFKLLQMANTTLNNYWDSKEFILWSTKVVSDLNTKVQFYCRTTGLCHYRKLLTQLMKLPSAEYDKQVERIEKAGIILHEFDRNLMSDILELLKYINDGLSKIPSLPKAETTLDQVALNAIKRDLQWCQLDILKYLEKLIQSICDHRHSWGGYLNKPSFANERRMLQDQKKLILLNIKNAIKHIDTLASK